MQKKYLWKLAWRNIIRAKRRSILTFSVLAFGVMMYILMECLLQSFQGISKRNLIEFETGDFKVRSVQYDEERPYIISNFIADYSGIEEELGGLDFVTGYTERINFLGELDAEFSSDIVPVLVTGVQLESDPEVFTLTNFIEKGEIREGGLVIGKDLAEDMDVMVYDYANITFRNAHGTYDSYEFEVSGIIHSADPMVNNSVVFITLGDAQMMLDVTSVTEIAVKTKDYEKIEDFLPEAESALSGYSLYSWKDLGADMLAFMQADAAGGYIFILMIIVIAIGGTINTMMLSVYEKQREIGMLKALGMTARDVKRLFLIEGFQIGMMGSFVGLILGALVNLYFVLHGWDITKMFGGVDNIGYRLMGTIHSEWDISAFLIGFLGSVLATTLAAYFPARRTTRLMPVEALRVKN